MILTYKEQEIQQREKDGYVNLTQMAKANGVNINDWSKTQVTKSYIQALESETTLIATELLIINKGGIPSQQGTWAHPLLALNFGRWISPEFAIWCDKHIKTLLETGKTELQQGELIPFVNQQVEKEKSALGLADYIELKVKLDGLKQDRITELLNYRFVSELEGLNVNQRQLGTATVTEQKHYQPCNLRAKDLGYNIYQVSNGTELGRYVKKLVEPAFKDYQGQYHVWHYEVNNELDNAIHSYFKKDIRK
jgi:hypothetical protein